MGRAKTSHTPAEFNAGITAQSAEGGAGAAAYPAIDLASFRWHTGATLSPLRPDEPCPVLFRDIGPEAMAAFLRGRLRRLAGPFTPITYLRTQRYVEPYTDFGGIGRLIVLQPLRLHVWHSGIAHIYIARADVFDTAAQIGFVPGDVSLTDAAEMAQPMRALSDWRDALGGVVFDDAIGDTLDRLDRLNATHAESERMAEPLRRRLQSSTSSDRKKIREAMQRLGLTESDLCAAWHHLPAERREFLRAEGLPELARECPR